MLTDIINQTINLIIYMKDEVHRINQNENNGSPSSIRALKSSVLSLQFNYIETLCNFIANLIIEINNKNDGAPKPNQILSQEIISKVKEDGKFTSIEDKVALFPDYLASIFGVQFKIEKGGYGWQKFMEIRQKRNMLMHPKMSEDDKYINLSIDNIKPNIEMKDSDLFVGLEVLYWFNSEIEVLFQLIGINDESLYDNINFYMLFLHLSVYSELDDTKLNKIYKFTNSKVIMDQLPN